MNSFIGYNIDPLYDVFKHHFPLDLNATNEQKEFYDKNLSLYVKAYRTLEKRGFALIFSNLGVQDQMMTFDMSRFISIYPYDSSWLIYSEDDL